MACYCIGPPGNCPCLRAQYTVTIQAQHTGVIPDPEYDLIVPTAQKRGRQCGQCGMKFDYGVGYGYCCSSMNCPMGWR